MTDNDNLPLITVHVTVIAAGSGFEAVYQPNPAAVPGRKVKLRYLLDSAGWAFDAIAYDEPFSDLIRVSATEFRIADDGTKLGNFRLAVELVSKTAAGNGGGGPGGVIDTDPEVSNSPPPV